MTLEDIKEMANNPQLKFTKKIKEILIAEARLYNIEIPQCACRNKWSDLLLQLYAIKRGEARLQPKYRYLLSTAAKTNCGEFNAATPNDKIDRLKRTNPLLFKKLYREI